MIELFDHQAEALKDLKNGNILCGGVGSGKSLTALAYFYTKELGGSIDSIRGLSPIQKEKDLYIITTAAKRDTLDWDREAAVFALFADREEDLARIHLTVDSWNNINKYINVKDSFFIFDEQRVIGSGTWVKAFLKITNKNNWLLLSATPGDTWLDYIPVFIANGFYKNRTEFIRRHVVYNTFIKFPKVDRYIEESVLNRYKRQITVNMDYTKKTTPHKIYKIADYDPNLFDLVYKERWNPYKDIPIKDIGEFCYVLRKVVNSDRSRLDILRTLIEKHNKVIVFYNFNYELDILRELKEDSGLSFSEYNGHRHEPIPTSDKWCYAVQFLSGAEGWNCIETDSIVFWSLNYSYRIMTQAAGRIDRLNTPFKDLYYYYIKSNSQIDEAISKALEKKKNFNVLRFERTSR